MRRLLWLPVLVLLWASALYGAMGYTRALQEAKKLWGPLANIGQVRKDPNWLMQVGFTSTGCRQEFTVLGSGLNSWEAAFYQVKPTAVRGPYSGLVELVAVAWDDAGVAGFQWWLDGVPFERETFRFPTTQRLDVSVPFDTRLQTKGIHVLCAQARDVAGNVERTVAVLINIDQTKPSASRVINLMPVNPGPSVP